METAHRDIIDKLELELALLRRGVDQRSTTQECCSRCRRVPLIGERVYLLDRGAVVCELCRTLQREEPLLSRVVHTPAFGQTMRVIDQRHLRVTASAEVGAPVEDAA